MKTQEAALTHTIRIANQPAQVKAPVAIAKRPILLRHVIGEQLRRLRNEQNRTLREVSRAAQVSLGYLSEVERGQKEVSSEILASVADALEVPLSVVMREVPDRVAALEGIYLDDTYIPDTVPDAFVTEASLLSR